jgi:FAS-associated factor 2
MSPPDQIEDDDVHDDSDSSLNSDSSSSSAPVIIGEVRHRHPNQGNNNRNNPRARDQADSEQHHPPSSSSSSPSAVSIWSGAIIRVLSLPFSLIIDTLFRIARFALDLIRADPGVGHDPLAEVAAYIHEFEQRYGRDHINFFTGSYDQALTSAKRELKFLLVYLHTFADPAAEEFVNEVLNHEVVRQYVNRNLITWSCSTSSYEGYKVSNGLREQSGRPLIAIIVQKEEGFMRLVRRIEITNNNSSNSSSSSSGSSSPVISVERFLSIIDQTITQHESYIRSQREDRAAREMNQEIRRQQDLDYEMSLAVDREKEQRKAEEKKRQEEVEKRKQEAVNSAAKRKQAMMQLRKQLKDALPDEPEASAADVLKILIKLPDGSRLERRFAPNDPISLLYQFVYSHESAPTSFQIVSNFPRKVLPGVSPTPENPDCLLNGSSADGHAAAADSPADVLTFQQIGLGKNELLFVHDLEA